MSMHLPGYDAWRTRDDEPHDDCHAVDAWCPNCVGCGCEEHAHMRRRFTRQSDGEYMCSQCGQYVAERELQGASCACDEPREEE